MQEALEANKRLSKTVGDNTTTPDCPTFTYENFMNCYRQVFKSLDSTPCILQNKSHN